MACVGDYILTRGSIPHLHGLIFTCGSNAGAIGGPGNGPDCIGMTIISIDMTCRGTIPYLHGFIMSARGNTTSVRRPYCRIDDSSMTSIHIDDVPQRCRSWDS